MKTFDLGGGILFSLIVGGLYLLCVKALHDYYQKIENKYWKNAVGVFSGIFTVGGAIQILSFIFRGKAINLD
jgi:hypothetical protein